MTYEELATKLHIAEGFKSSFIEAVKEYGVNTKDYYGSSVKYAKENNLEVNEDIIKNDMFNRLYDLADTIDDKVEAILIRDMAWDLFGDNQEMNYGLDMLSDFLEKKEIFIEANRRVANIAKKECGLDNYEDIDQFNDDSNDYLGDNWNEFYDMLNEKEIIGKI